MDGLSEDEFERLYKRLSRPLLVSLARRTLDTDVALDLWAEAWAAAFAARRRYRGSSDAEAEAWVRVIASRQHAMYVRRGRAERRALGRLGLERPVVTDEEIADLELSAGLAELRAAVAAGLEELTAPHREVLRLRVVEERPYRDVAQALRVSEPTARARVSRALRELKERLPGSAHLDTGAP